jgi:hypothetical protein
MEVVGLLDLFPVWALMIVTVIVVLLSVEAGHRLARYRQRSGEERQEPAGAMVGATLGLLAFMLAFTFGMAASRFDDRRQVVLAEANAIGTTYLRAEMLPEPMRTDTRSLLREYVAARLEATRPGQVDAAVVKSEELQGRLWAQAVTTAAQANTPITGLYIQSLNDVIDLHAKRVMVSLRSRVPGAIWLTLYVLAILAMLAMGYQQGVSGSKRSLAVGALVLSFSMVLMLIVSLDRPDQGLFRVSQQAMIDLQRSMPAPGVVKP